MPFTFECGVCHAVYRLDEHQITASGVKVTCPKCLNYFFLKRGGTESIEKPVVEYMVPDGAYDLTHRPAPFSTPPPPQLPAQPTISPPAPKAPPPPKASLPPPTTLKPTNMVVAPKSAPPPKDPVDLKPDLFYAPPKTTAPLAASDLLEYPPDAPPKTPMDQYFWPVAAILFVVIALLFFNYERVLTIPGLTILQKSEPQPEPTIIVPQNPSKNSKYGFPKVDAGYDPWTGAPIPATPSPSGK